MGKTALDAKRKEIFMIEPERLTLVTDKSNSLYDPRVEDAPSESMILNVAYHGVLEPILVRKNGGDIEVIAGRGRTKAALEVNRRNVKQGCEQMLVPVIVRGGSDVDLCGIMVSENEIRREDSMIIRGQKARKLLNMGKSEREIAIIFGVTENTVKNWLSADELPQEVKQAVETGEIKATSAIQNSNLSQSEQVEKLNEMREGGTKKTVRQSRMRNGREVEEKFNSVSNYEDPYGQGFYDALAWILRKEQ